MSCIFLLWKQTKSSCNEDVICFEVLHTYKRSPTCALNVNNNEKVAGGEARSQLLIGILFSFF